ncbi:MAG: hypothetical protein DMD92_18485 [Candidatus Rokuibacteriota bacterium]|nr:MAG: hypothetical protein DMD92_18485 [Candidatus Rokubacteria bacterium]
MAAVALGLMWLAPSAADAATLKRVHSGTTNVPSASVVNVTLELQDATKAFVFCPTRTTSGNSSHRVTCTLSTNNLAIDGGTNVTNANTVSWFVAEFESGVSVVRGTSTFNAGSATPSAAPVIGTVDCSKSFVALAGEQTDTALTSINDEEFTFLGVLGTFAAPCAVTAGTTTSTLTLSRLATTNAATVAWQVVTMDGATVVARNTATIAINALTASPASFPLTDSTKSFVLMSRRAGTAIAGVENLYMVRGDFDSTSCSGSPLSCTKVIFTRDLQTGAANTQVDVAYEVITLNDGGTVQRPASATASSGTTATMGLAGNIAAIDRSAAVPFFTGSVGGATSSNLYLDKGSWTAAFPSTTQLQFTRGISSTVVGTVNWFVVSFYKCPTTYSRLCSMGVTGGNDSATVSWSPIYDPACLSGSTPTKCEAVVLRSQSTIAFAPSNGTAYAVGAQPAAGVFVAFNGTAQTFTENPANLTNGTQYFYRVYPKVNGATTYMTDISNTVSQVNVTPSANANLAWSYMTTGGSTLNAPSAGNGRVYVASNGSKMVALNSSTGVELATPLITNGAIQSYLSWFPVSGGTNEAVVAGDQIGRLTSMDAVTGARNWTVQLPVDATGFIQATLSAQLLAYTQGGYKCDTGAGFSGTYTTDLIYVASRDNGLMTNNVWAVRADTGQIQWTFTPGTAMDRAVGQPYVDYCRDRLWVSTGNNAGQKSLWVVNTLTGTEVTSFPSVGNQVDSAPTPSADGTTVYVGDAAGNVYAFDAATNGNLKKYSLLLAGTSPTIKGYIWEDWTTPGKLYIPVITNGSAGVWCVQDNGSALVACPSWTTNPRTGSSTLAEPLVTGTAIFFPVSTGIIYQLNTSDGTLYGGTGHPFTVESGVALGGISTEDWTQLYVGTSSGRSYRINLTGGNLP